MSGDIALHFKDGFTLYNLVGGLEHVFPIYWVANHPNGLIFFRGVAQPPTSNDYPPAIKPSNGRSHIFRRFSDVDKLKINLHLVVVLQNTCSTALPHSKSLQLWL